jgi:hypothetical protein
MKKQTAVEELFNKYLEIVESTSYKISYYHKCLLISELEEMMKQQIKDAYLFGLEDEYVIGSENYYKQNYEI